MTDPSLAASGSGAPPVEIKQRRRAWLAATLVPTAASLLLPWLVIYFAPVALVLQLITAIRFSIARAESPLGVVFRTLGLMLASVAIMGVAAIGWIIYRLYLHGWHEH